MRKLCLAAALIVALSLFLAACGGGEEAPAPAPAAKAEPAAPAPAAPAPAPKEEPGVIDVGIMTIATGFGAAWGMSYHIAKQIAADEVNAEGGLLVGGKKYRVNADVQDSRYEVPVMLSIAEKWINQDKKRFIITNGDPMIGLVDPKSTPLKIIHVSSTWDLEPVKNPYTFGYLSVPFETAPILYEVWKKEEPQVKSLMHIPVNFRFDLNAAKSGEEWAKKMGFEWRGTAIVEGDQVDMLPTANAAVAKNPDAIILGGLGGNGAAMVRALRDLGFKGPIGSFWATPSLDQLLTAFKDEPQYVEDVYGMESVGYPGDPDQDAIIKAYEKRAAGSGITPTGLNE